MYRQAANMAATLLVAIAGSSITITTATAQTTQPDERYTDRDRDQNREYARDRGERTSSELLGSMQGIWTVEVRVNAKKWGDAKSSKSEERTIRNRDSDRNNNADRNNRGDREATHRDHHGMADADGFVTLKAISSAQMVLGENILRERMIFTDHDFAHNRRDADRSTDRDRADRDRTDLNVIDRTRDRERDADDRRRLTQNHENRWSSFEDMRGIAYFSFDNTSDTYTCVFMNNTEGAIRTDTGKFDEKNQQIIFHGDSDRSGAYGQVPLRTVLKKMGDDGFRVTTYVVDADVDKNDQPATLNNSMINRAPDNDDKRYDDWMKDSNIMYQATYTRANRADSRRITAMLDGDDAINGVFATPERELDRDWDDNDGLRDRRARDRDWDRDRSRDRDDR